MAKEQMSQMLLNLDWCKCWVIKRPFSFLVQLSGTLTIPWWQWFLTRFGKKTAVYVGMLVSKKTILFSALIWRGCAFYGISLSTVGSTLHAPHRLHQEPPDHFLHGVRGCRRERGGSFPPALVSSSSPGSDAGLLYPEFISKCCLCAFRSMLPDVVDDFKVRNPHIHGHEAIFFSFYVFFIKFSSGVSLGISTLSLK